MIEFRTSVSVYLSNSVVQGVMVARGILSNPAMFEGHPTTPQQCINDWVRLLRRQTHLILSKVLYVQVEMPLSVGTTFNCFHHHLAYMSEEVMSKPGLTNFLFYSSLVS